MSHPIYLDYNASAPMNQLAKEGVLRAMDLVGNGSSVHSKGRKVHKEIDLVREKIATFLGTRSDNVVFTSSGTEANNMALSPAVFGDITPDKSHLFLSAIEHPSALKGHRFSEEHVSIIPVTKEGVVDLAWLSDQLDHCLANEIRPLVSVMAVNNETGVIQPIQDIAPMVRSSNGYFHVDCVQALGKIACSFADLSADFISLSAHKIGGPQGVGVLALRPCCEAAFAPLIKGGGQEISRRSGTENLLGVLGFGGALDHVLTNDIHAQLKSSRNFIEDALKDAVPDVVIFGESVKRVANTVCFAVPNVTAEQALIMLDLKQICLSSGAACSSGRLAASHVLLAMGVNEGLAACTLRLSMGEATTKQELKQFLQAYTAICEKQKQKQSAA